jgi:hypothetical protein
VITCRTPSGQRTALVAAHRGFDRDTARLLWRLGRIDVPAPTWAEQAQRWMEAASVAVEDHLRLEHEILWPLARRRDPDLDRWLVAEQQRHDELLQALSSAVAASRRLASGAQPLPDAAKRALEDAVVRLRALLLQHTEEPWTDASLRLVGELPDAELRSLISSSRRRHGSRRTFGVVWQLDAATADERRLIWAGLVPGQRWTYRLGSQRAYRRLVGVLR